jgi:hypothetical protein
LVGRTVDSIYKLDVNGTARTNRISPYRNGNIAIGEGSSAGTFDNSGAIAIGQQVLEAGSGNVFGNIGIGNFSLRLGSKSPYNIAIGNGALSNGGGFGHNTIVGSLSIQDLDDNSQFGNNTVLGSSIGTKDKNAKNSVAIGVNSLITGSNQFIAGGIGADTLNTTAITNVYFGSGVQGNQVAATNGISYTINGSGAFGGNRPGGSVTIAGGKGTGNATPGFVAFSTSTPLSSPADSLTLQTLTERARISPAGNLLVGTATDVPSSKLTVTSTTQGFLQPIVTNTQRDAISTPEQGLQVFSTTDSANYVYRGTGGGWQKIANEISGSATLNFPNTGHGNSADLTFTVTGASEGDVVALGIPNASIVANASFTAWVSATNTITVRFNNYASSGSSDPANGTFKIKVFK